eukprot:2272661-Karenia_brevis.AAC.1
MYSDDNLFFPHIDLSTCKDSQAHKQCSTCMTLWPSHHNTFDINIKQINIKLINELDGHGRSGKQPTYSKLLPNLLGTI